MSFRPNRVALRWRLVAPKASGCFVGGTERKCHGQGGHRPPVFFQGEPRKQKPRSPQRRDQLLRHPGPIRLKGHSLRTSKTVQYIAHCREPGRDAALRKVCVRPLAGPFPHRGGSRRSGGGRNYRRSDKQRIADACRLGEIRFDRLLVLDAKAADQLNKPVR